MGTQMSLQDYTAKRNAMRAQAEAAQAEAMHFGSKYDLAGVMGRTEGRPTDVDLGRSAATRAAYEAEGAPTSIGERVGRPMRDPTGVPSPRDAGMRATDPGVRLNRPAANVTDVVEPLDSYGLRATEPGVTRAAEPVAARAAASKPPGVKAAEIYYENRRTVPGAGRSAAQSADIAQDLVAGSDEAASAVNYLLGKAASVGKFARSAANVIKSSPAVAYIVRGAATPAAEVAFGVPGMLAGEMYTALELLNDTQDTGEQLRALQRLKAQGANGKTGPLTRADLAKDDIPNLAQIDQTILLTLADEGVIDKSVMDAIGEVGAASAAKQFAARPAAPVGKASKSGMPADAIRAMDTATREQMVAAGVLTNEDILAAEGMEPRSSAFPMAATAPAPPELAAMRAKKGENPLAVGAKGDSVRFLQEDLQKVGAGDLVDIARSGGTFDERTRAAVKKFQQQAGLKVDGIVGPQTRQALDAALAQNGFREQRLQGTLDRLRNA